MFTDLKPYPEYGDSGRNELPHIPHSWRVRRLKSICRFSYGNALPDEERDPGSVLVMGSNGPIGHHSVVNTWGETIVIGRKGSFGKVHYSSVPVFVMDTAYFVDRRSSAAIIEWLAAALRWLPLDQNSRDSAVPGLDREEAHGYFVPYPPLEEQAAIVKYLGHANARIERAIAAKRKLIALLEEQKQAIIKRAVTRGLDPTVPLKDSGIPWLGQIPQHWSVRRAKYLFRDIDIRSETGLEEQLSVSHLTGVSPRRLKTITMFKAASYVGHKTCLAGDLVVNTMWAWMGALGIAREAGLVSPAYNVYRPVQGAVINADFVGALFRTPTCIAYFRTHSTGVRASRLRFYPDELLATPVVLPPWDEQAQIVQWIRDETQTTEAAADRASREIELLREFKARLTADVVTGQLDIRDVAARLPEMEPANLVSDVGESDEDDLDAELAESLAQVDA